LKKKESSKTDIIIDNNIKDTDILILIDDKDQKEESKTNYQIFHAKNFNSFIHQLEKNSINLPCKFSFGPDLWLSLELKDYTKYIIGVQSKHLKAHGLNIPDLEK